MCVTVCRTKWCVDDCFCFPFHRGICACAPLHFWQVYTEAVLGSAPDEYAQNILQPKAWGGAIELSLFAHHYGVEMVAIDIKTGTPYRYGEDQRYATRAFFMYSGIHYDAVAMTPFEGAPEALDQATFATTDDWAFGCALGLATELRKVRLLFYRWRCGHMLWKCLLFTCRGICGGRSCICVQKKAFTDVHSFKLRCSVCRQGFVGQADAVVHATATGHQQFEEY
jgi:ubiquitin thioesterase OTU1